MISVLGVLVLVLGDSRGEIGFPIDQVWRKVDVVGRRTGFGPGESDLVGLGIELDIGDGPIGATSD